MKDILIKGLICQGRARIFLARTTGLCEKARVMHDLWPTSTAVLGRVLSISTVLGCMLKGEHEKITVQINGDGPIGTVMVDAYSNGRTRGFVGDPHIMLLDNHTGKLAVGQAVGKNGYLRVIRDITLKNDFTGTVKLYSGEIGDDFAYYFTVSEQTPTAVSVGVLVDNANQVTSAGVLVIQMMPDATEEDIAYCEDIIAKIAPISELIVHCSELDELAKQLFSDVEIIDRLYPYFECDCSRERTLQVLSSVTDDELEAMIKEDHGCEIVCQYCNKRYRYSEEELYALLKQKRKLS